MGPLRQILWHIPRLHYNLTGVPWGHHLRGLRNWCHGTRTQHSRVGASLCLCNCFRDHLLNNSLQITSRNIFVVAPASVRRGGPKILELDYKVDHIVNLPQLVDAQLAGPLPMDKLGELIKKNIVLTLPRLQIGLAGFDLDRLRCATNRFGGGWCKFFS